MSLSMKKLSEYISYDSNDEKRSMSEMFRMVAGPRMQKCSDSDGVLKDLGIVVHGKDKDLSAEIYTNCVILQYASEGDFFLSDDNAKVIAERMGKSPRMCTAGELYTWLGQEIGVDSEVSEDTTKDAEKVEKKEEPKKAEKEEKQENGKVFDKDTVDKIKGYYSEFYRGVVNELIKRYSSMFESGYEVVKPSGLITSEGLLYLSGTGAVARTSAPLSGIYNEFIKRMGFREVTARSNNAIAGEVFNGYQSGGVPLYFPFKLLEYAFGREAPDGDNQEARTSYKRHSCASNWSSYSKSEINKSLTNLIGATIVKYVHENAPDGDYKSAKIQEGLKSFLNYLKECLSVCLLMVEYKGKQVGYAEEIYSFKVRVCDPLGKLGAEDMTQVIIREAFMGSTGTVPFSYPLRVEQEVCVKEYAHEFNHDSAQAMPLFAYKAFMALREQNVNPDWNNMILGMFEDGSILKNGKHGVSLGNKLTHHICAGSRAGKGVMTLNILASGIYSGKNIFYLDRKPDMASMFKSLSPNMFAVNGAAWSSSDDTYGTFSNQENSINPRNIPSYVTNLLEVGCTWSDLGDLFYMRALKLVMGIILARGCGKFNESALGGKDGILLVVDEFKNFQESYALIIRKMKENLPVANDKYIMEKTKLAQPPKVKRDGTVEDNTADRVAFDRSFNHETFYALTYLNSMLADLEFLSTKRDAGFNPTENTLSDIFVIGQHLEHGDMDFGEFRNMLSSGRYKQVGRRGITGSYKIDFAKDSFGYSLVSFKTCDAFFGRNMEDGREVYLAQTKKNSKAFGRLDDKSGNFAYMSSFTSEKRKKIVDGKEQDNVAMANSCTYFKPFLVLNDAKQGDTYTNQMFLRCQGPNPEDPWVTPEEIIRENPNADGLFVNEAVGFEGYMNLMGASNYSSVLAKGANIANYVVQNYLGYPGDWFAFITDLRPQYIFTVKDIVEASKGNKISWNDYKGNPVFAEFADFDPNLFGVGSSDGGTNTSGGYEDMSRYSYDKEDDYSNTRYQEEKEKQDMADIFRKEDEELDEDQEFDLDDMANQHVIRNRGIYETGFGDTTEEELLREIGEKDAIIAELMKRLANIEDVLGTRKRSKAQTAYDDSFEFGGGSRKNGTRWYESSDGTEFNKEVKFDGSSESFLKIREMVTDDILEKFGGLGRITSIKVVGGSLVINKKLYSCRLGSIASKGIPVELRREINSGSIAKYFRFDLIWNDMPRLRILDFDSARFVNSYVLNEGMSIDSFFRYIESLQGLGINGRLYTRENYEDAFGEVDVMYTAKASTRFADFSEELLGRYSNKSWEFTKNTYNSKEHRKAVKAAKVVAGAGVAAVTKVGEKTVQGTRKLTGGIKRLGRSLKNAWDESKNY